MFQPIGWTSTYSLADETGLRGLIVNIATFQVHGLMKSRNTTVLSTRPFDELRKIGRLLRFWSSWGFGLLLLHGVNASVLLPQQSTLTIRY